MNNFTQFSEQSVRPQQIQKSPIKNVNAQNLQHWESFIRMILALTIVANIVLDIILIAEFKSNNRDQHFAVMLAFLIAPFGLIFLGKICNLIANNTDYTTTYLHDNPCLRFFFNLFGIFGFEAVFYYFQSAISMVGNLQMDQQMYSPFQTRKLQATLESVINSFVVSHYIFFSPESSQAAIACLIIGCLNAIFAFCVHHTGQKTFVSWLVENICCIRFIQTLSEVLGRALFFGCTALIYLKKSDFQSELPYYLTYEFFISDAIALAIACFIALLIYWWITKFFTVSIMIIFQNFLNSILIRPTIDYEVVQSNSLENVKKFLTFGQIPDKQNINLIEHIMIFPAIWRILEYIVLMAVLYDEFFLYKAKVFSEAFNQYQVYNLAILTIVLNIINLTLIILVIAIIYVSPKPITETQQAVNISQDLLQSLRNQVSQATQQMGNGIRETFENCQNTIQQTFNHQLKNNNKQ